MKRVLVAVAACAALGAWGQSMNFQEARKKLPQFNNLPDDSFVDVVHQVYYPNMDKADLASRLGVEINKEPTKPKLGPIDQWRYVSCQKEAAQAPTQLGVTTGLRLCREKFGQ